MEDLVTHLKAHIEKLETQESALIAHLKEEISSLRSEVDGLHNTVDALYERVALLNRAVGTARAVITVAKAEADEGNSVVSGGLESAETYIEEDLKAEAAITR